MWTSEILASWKRLDKWSCGLNYHLYWNYLLESPSLKYHHQHSPLMLQNSSAHSHRQPHLNFITIPHPYYTSHVCHKRNSFTNSNGQIQWRDPPSLPPRSTSLPLVLQFPPLVHPLHSWLQEGLIWFKMGEPIRDLSEVHFNDID